MGYRSADFNMFSKVPVGLRTTEKRGFREVTLEAMERHNIVIRSGEDL